MRRILHLFKLDNPIPDKNKLYNGEIVPKTHSRLIYTLSHIWFLNALYGFYRGHYNHSLIPLTVGITSLLYWNKPRYNYIRLIDISACIFGSFYVTYYTLYTDHITLYFIIKCWGILSYIFGILNHKNGFIIRGTIFHLCVHLSAQISCILLFSTNPLIFIDSSKY